MSVDQIDGDGLHWNAAAVITDDQDDDDTSKYKYAMIDNTVIGNGKLDNLISFFFVPTSLSRVAADGRLCLVPHQSRWRREGTLRYL